jgi:hypothetical protein
MIIYYHIPPGISSDLFNIAPARARRRANIEKSIDFRTHLCYHGLD